jgi:hypothetical protein
MPDCHRCGRPAAEHIFEGGTPVRCPQIDYASAAKVSLIVVGLVIAVAAGLIWYVTRTDAALCGSSLVTALNPGGCDRAVTVHDVAAAGVLAGLALFIAGAVRR